MIWWLMPVINPIHQNSSSGLKNLAKDLSNRDMELARAQFAKYGSVTKWEPQYGKACYIVWRGDKKFAKCRVTTTEYPLFEE